MIIENLPVLNEWLISYLEPICDADPHALAKYIMALIRKDKTENELKKICLEQLEVFLVNETNAFVDKLFVALNNKSYLNNSNNSNSSNNNSNKINNQSTTNEPTQQRSRSPKQLHRNVPAPSGSSRRYQNQVIPINTSSQATNKYEKHSRSPNRYSPSRNSPKKRRSRSRSLGKNSKRNRSRSPPQQQQQQQQQQQSNHNPHVQMPDNRNFNNSSRRCRDYDEKGFCMRGNLCSFVHGQNALVLDTSNPNSVLGLANSQTNNLNTLLPTPSNQKKAQQPKQFTEPYNPEEPAIDKQEYRPSVNDKRNGLTNIYLSNEFNNNDDKFNKKHMNNPSHQNRQANNRAPFRSNNKRNSKPYSNSTNDNSEKTTLMVSKIPSNQNTITNLNEHFSKFGTITNLKIHYDNDPESSLVEFSTNGEALAAYRSTEPILNNRFIKVYWHSSGSSSGGVGNQTTKDDKPNENDEADKVVEKKQSIKDRLGKIVEKQTSITNTAVTNLLNSGLIGNAPNQLASLMIGSSKLPNTKPSTPVSKPVFDPAKLKKQYTSTTTNSTPSNTTPTTTTSSIASTAADLITNKPINAFTSNTLTKPLTKSITSINKQQPNKEKLIKRLELQKKRQEMLSTYIQQNKLLVDKLEKSKTDAEKQSIRETVDLLTKKIKQLEADIKKGNSSIIEETNLQKQQFIIF